MEETAIRFEGVSKKYRLGLSRTSLPTLITRSLRSAFSAHSRAQRRNGAFWALKDLSFDLLRGQCLALLGPNGAGKTTVLKLLSNITKPTTGNISVNGRLAALIELGAGFHPDLTGRENIFLNGAILGLERSYILAHLEEIIAFSELEQFIDTPIKRYSSGMAVRLGFSVASCIQPDILLIDEVLAVGDLHFQQKCLKRIQSLIDAGTAIIFVSHNLYMVQAICTHALYISRGRLQCSGKTRDVIAAYEHDIHLEEGSPSSTGQAHPVHARTGPAITGVEVVSSAGQSGAGTLHSSDSATIRIRYDAPVDAGPVHVSAFIKRADGATCCMMRSSAAGPSMRLAPGGGTVSVNLKKLQLTTGTYCVEAYMLDESDSVALSSSAVVSPWFFVKGAGLSSSHDSGVYEPLASWTQD
ncbi:MAG: ATP-binding cassette domain-containing protein [Bryobacterales bacterium]|nr:ATP-binding cassette domain-containing protein [Bryobacterales bacterium]